MYSLESANLPAPKGSVTFQVNERINRVRCTFMNIEKKHKLLINLNQLFLQDGFSDNYNYFLPLHCRL